MTKFLVIAICAILSGTAALAQSEKYQAAMKQNIDELETAMSKGTMPDLANNFERIAEAEKTQWLPYYYAAYCTVMNAFMEQDKSKTDGIADKAEQLIKKAEELAGGENSEICVIKSMIASAHMMVDPQNRWMEYGQVSSLNITKAKTLDPSNPRPIYLEGQAKFYTPEQFGGGKAPAKELFIRALEMFDKFQPASNLHPSWGRSATNYFLAQCN
ncbi:MAG TPA: hypothetical protein VD993_12450 [Chitinophagaceae bacterium]|nr:hypothetical protein [Chitinophagaceae bacterium]